MKTQNAERNGVSRGFHVGDQVVFKYGVRDISGRIVEDRGNIGVGGRRLYRIEADVDGIDSLAIELPIDDFKSVM